MHYYLAIYDAGTFVFILSKVNCLPPRNIVVLFELLIFLEDGSEGGLLDIVSSAAFFAAYFRFDTLSSFLLSRLSKYVAF